MNFQVSLNINFYELSMHCSGYILLKIEMIVGVVSKMIFVTGVNEILFMFDRLYH